MRDLKQYWQEVRALQRSLPEFIWLMSLEDPKRGMTGGRLAELGAEQAAKLLHAKTYRQATEEEIAAHLAKEEQTRRQSFNAGLRRRGIAVVAVPTAAEKASVAAKGDKRADTRRR